MHIVYKQSSSTTKVCVVFDASAQSSTGVSLNNLLLVGLIGSFNAHGCAT